MNPDFVEILSALFAARAEFLIVIVGAHALAAHGHPRATGDLDIWVNATRANGQRVLQALATFGAPLGDLTLDDLTQPDTVFQIGVAPCRVDIMTGISGVRFEEAWPRRMALDVEGVAVDVLGREDIVANKRATGRLKDLADLESLE